MVIRNSQLGEQLDELKLIKDLKLRDYYEAANAYLNKLTSTVNDELVETIESAEIDNHKFTKVKKSSFIPRVGKRKLDIPEIKDTENFYDFLTVL